MAKQTINIGTTANDGTGDAIRAAFGKVNDNFTEIYTANTGVNTGDQNLSAYATTAAVAAGYQPLDSDLTAISALTTTAYGRALLSTADAATLRSAIGVGQTDAPTFLAQTLTGQSLTGTQATSLVDLSATWNTTGTPSALKLNVTDTASNANSLLMDLQVGGLSKCKIDKTGVITPINVYAGGAVGYALFNDVGLGLRSAAVIGWTAGNALNAQDTILARDAAGVIAQRNGANAQMFRVYNTYTDASNYERLHIGYSSGAAAFQILSDALGTGAPKQLVIGTNTNASLVLMTGSLSKWYVNSAGHFLAATHNAYDIGATGGVSCPRNIFAAGTVHATGFSVAFQSNITGTGVALYDGNTGTSIKTNAAAGIILLGNAIASTDFGRLQLGGTTDSFPAIARDGAGTKFTGGAAGSTSWIKVPAVAVASLPAAATAGVGARSFVNDALTPVFGSAVTGGGAVTVPVYSTGSAWNVG